MWGTSDICLEFERHGNSMVGFVDSDFTGDFDRRRSITSYVFTLGEYIISWKASLQPIIALSTTEAEYITVTETIKRAIWLRGLFCEFSLVHDVTIVHYDSQSAIHLTRDQMFHERTKYIDVRYHFIRDIISQDDVTVTKIGTANNPANMLTKSLPIVKFKYCSDLIGVCSIWVFFFPFEK